MEIERHCQDETAILLLIFKLPYSLLNCESPSYFHDFGKRITTTTLSQFLRTQETS